MKMLITSTHIQSTLLTNHMTPILSQKDTEKVITKAQGICDEFNFIRNGQALMIALNEVAPNVYKSITGTIHDPFYDDSKINDFLIQLL